MDLRVVCGVAGALACLSSPPRPALGQTMPEAQSALCEAAAPPNRVLTEAEAAACRQLWQDGIAAARLRQQAYQQSAIEAFANRKNRQKVEGPVPLSTFIGDDTLDFGDIVMIDEGPRVYTGKAYEPAKSGDFLTLDAPRSPHRKRAGELLKALRR